MQYSDEEKKLLDKKIAEARKLGLPRKDAVARGLKAFRVEKRNKATSLDVPGKYQG